MSFESPSDRLQVGARGFWSSVKRFVLLQPLDGRKLAKAVWTLTLLIYGFQLLGSLISLPFYFLTVQRFAEAGDWWRAYAPLFLAPLVPLLWLMVIRVVLQACDKVFRERLGEADGTDSK